MEIRGGYEKKKNCYKTLLCLGMCGVLVLSTVFGQSNAKAVELMEEQ